MMLPGLRPSVLCILSVLTLASCRREQNPSRRFIGSIVHAIDHVVHDVGHGIDHVVHDVGHGIDHAVHEVGNGIDHAVHEVGNGIDHAVDEVGNGIDHAVHEVGNGIDHVVHEVGNGIDHVVHEVGHGIDHVVHEVGHGIDHVVHEVGHGIDHAVHEVEHGIDHAVHDVGNGIDHAVYEVGNGIDHVVHEVGNGIDHVVHEVKCHVAGCGGGDLKPPLINHCPASKLYVADRGSTSTTVRWEKVTGVDPPTALTPLVVQTEGPLPGSVVGEGRHHVEYKVVDAAGNVAVHPCSFNVTVQAVRCSAPRLDNKPLLQYACPTDRIHGSECLLSCHHGNLAGPRKIVCEKDNFFPPSAQWRWNTTTGVQPHCQVRSCPALRPPRGGALSCDGWDTGALCQMQCRDGFTFPSAAQSGIFVCGHDNKTWFPPTVPDCLATSTFYSISMASNFYYRGQCDQTHLQQVRRNFILALKASMFGLEMCKDVLACQADNVRVTCGSRTKRDINPTIRVRVKFTFPYKLLGNDTTARGLMKFKDTFVKGIKGSAKLLTIGSKHLLLDSHLTSFEELYPRCRRGQKTVSDTCSGCGPGYVLNRVTETCVACPVGYFQDRDSAPWCQPCPLRHTTSTSAATSFTECATRCPPGEYSDTGLSPCSLCPLGTFQPDHSSTSCRRCPPGTITPLDGAVTIQDCQAYDVTIAGHGKALFRQHARDLKQWTYSMWFRLHDSTQGDVMLGQWSTNAAQQVVALSITNGTVNFYSQGNVYSKTGITLLPAWNHCVLTASEGAAAHVYVNGHDVLTVKTSMLSIPQNSRLHIVADAAGVSVSRVILRDYVIRDALIPGLARSCSVDETPRELDLDSIDYDQSNTDVIFPSVCHEGSQ